MILKQENVKIKYSKSNFAWVGLWTLKDISSTFGVIHQVIVSDKYEFWSQKTCLRFQSLPFPSGCHVACTCVQKESQWIQAIMLSWKARRLHFLAP
jgi:hypothetical protein